jgi:hypothetical protein
MRAPDHFSYDVPGQAWRPARRTILPTLGALLVLVVQLLGTARAELLCACGMDQVFLIQAPTNQGSPLKKLWSWRARDHEELPAAVRGSFGTTDDCKPVEGGAKILISSSGGACALVERLSGRVLWYARVPNAHSLELLPRDRVVAASSVDGRGNRLVLFELARSDQAVWATPLDSAHGVVWDEPGHCLWALGMQELRCYQLKDWDTAKPALALMDSYRLPQGNGHDLQPVPHTPDLVLSTGAGVLLFDRNTRQFRPHPQLGDTPDVKSVNVHPLSGRTVYTQGSSTGWWTDTLNFLAPDAKFQLPNERLYKVRWFPDPK